MNPEFYENPIKSPVSEYLCALYDFLRFSDSIRLHAANISNNLIRSGSTKVTICENNEISASEKILKLNMRLIVGVDW